jgi:hypothetical protein
MQIPATSYISEIKKNSMNKANECRVQSMSAMQSQPCCLQVGKLVQIAEGSRWNSNQIVVIHVAAGTQISQ